MRPDTSRTLQGIAVNLLTNVMGEMRTPFGQQAVGITAQLALWIAEECERGADRLVVENRATRELLRDGLALAGGARPEVDAALATPEAANFRISALQAENDALRKGLVALHAVVESTDGPEAAAFNERIWAELVESTRRRQFAVWLGG